MYNILENETLNFEFRTHLHKCLKTITCNTIDERQFVKLVEPTEHNLYVAENFAFILRNKCIMSYDILENKRLSSEFSEHLHKCLMLLSQNYINQTTFLRYVEPTETNIKIIEDSYYNVYL